MSSAAQPSGFRLAVAEGLLSALPDSPLALDTARKLLEGPGLTLEAAQRELRSIVESPRPCPTCGDVRALQEGACPNCGRVNEADSAADYPQRQAARPRRKRRRKRTEAALDELTEATVINNALVAGSVTGTRTPWGGANPAVAEPGVPLEALPGVTTPPNLRPAEGWEACANCVFYFKGCNLYGAGRPSADLVHALPYPVAPRRLRLAREPDAAGGPGRGGPRRAGRGPPRRRHRARRPPARPAREAGEVSSRVYPSLERSPKENWVEKAGGLPSYIERIAKHLHYEKGMTISHAIATAVNTVKKWCAGGKGKTTAATKAKACAAVAQWEAKKAKSKVSEAFAELELAARSDGSWRWPTLEEAGEILEAAERMEDVYPQLGGEPAVPRYVNRVAGHLRSKGKTPGQSIAIALTTARTVAAGDAGPEALREEARLAAAHWDALAGDGWWAAELAEAVDWETRDGRRLGGPEPPSEGFLRKLHDEIARADGPRWWEGMAEADAAELEEVSVVRTLKRGAAGVIDFDPLKHPRVAKGRKGGGQFADVLGKLSVEAKPRAGRAKPPSTMPLRDRLISELTQMDERDLKRTKGSRAKGYNPYAIAIMFGAVQEVFDPMIEKGRAPRTRSRRRSTRRAGCTPWRSGSDSSSTWTGAAGSRPARRPPGPVCPRPAGRSRRRRTRATPSSRSRKATGRSPRTGAARSRTSSP